MSRTLAIVLLALLAVPAGAGAATTVSVPKAHPVIKGDDAAGDVAVLVAEGPEFTFTAATGTLAAGEGCTGGPTTVTCTSERATLTGTLGGGDDRLTFQAPLVLWKQIDVRGAGGADRIDASAIPETEPYKGYSKPIFLYGGGGADELIGSGAGDSLSGDDGDDLMRGGPGDDALYAEFGRDRAYGEDGDDGVYADAGRGVYDGGAGDDLVQVVGGSVAVCGEGEDTVANETHNRPPGTLLRDDCERFYDFAGGHATQVGRRSLTFPVACSEQGRCKATLQIRWKGELVAERRFAGTRKAAPVRIAVPRALGRAIARRPQLLAMNIHDFRQEFGSDDIGFMQPGEFYWQVRVGA